MKSLFEKKRLAVAIDEEQEILQINGVNYSFKLFDKIAFDVSEKKFYRISEADMPQMRLFETFYLKETKENGDLVISNNPFKI